MSLTKNVLIGLGIAAGGILFDKYQEMYDSILARINPAAPDIILFLFVIIGIIAGFFKIKDRRKKEEKSNGEHQVEEYAVNPQAYRTHIRMLYDNLRERVEGRFARSYFDTVKSSDLRELLVQHMFTYYSYKDQKEIPQVFQNFLDANIADNYNLDPRLNGEFLNRFHTSFDTIYQAMKTGNPIIGVCDGCKSDYYDNNREQVLSALETYHRNEEEIRKLMDNITSF